MGTNQPDRKGASGQQRARREVSAGGVVFRRQPPGGYRVLLIRDSYGHWGLPKGHLEQGETAAAAAARETTEETGLADLILHANLETIDWYFRLRGKLIHKFCHFYLFESRDGQPCPQAEEGITECAWFPFDGALASLGYENARGVLRKAGEHADRLVAPGAAADVPPGR